MHSSSDESNTPEDRRPLVANKLNAELVDPGLVENIRCTNCSKYFFPPIYLCPKGHNLCNVCISKQGMNFNPRIFSDSNNPSLSSFSFRSATVPKFNFNSTTASSDLNTSQQQTLNKDNSVQPTIRHYFCGQCKEYVPKNENRRSAARERSIKILNFPCGNAANSCSYRNYLLCVDEHEKTCMYAKRSCFIPECNWKGTNSNIKSHFQELHNYISLNKPEVLGEGKNIYPVLFDDTFFLLKTMYVPCGTMHFSVLYLAEMRTYRFELCLIGDNEEIGIKLSNYCEPLLNENVKNNVATEDIPIPVECLKHFITDLGKLRFIINIVKID